MRKLTALLCLCTFGPLLAEPAANEKYRLEYGVEWRMVRAGTARIDWTSTPADGQHADLHLESVGLVNKLYRVNDDYSSRMTSGLCATSVLFRAEEGKRRRETNLNFHKNTGKVNYVERDLLKNSTVLTKELQVPQCTFEYLGALHHLRELKLNPGQSTTVPLTDGKKFAQVKVEAQEKEQIKTPLGTFNTVRYEIHMFNDVIISRKAKMYLWLTDDARKLPVQLRLRMQFLIGTITLQLEKEEKL